MLGEAVIRTGSSDHREVVSFFESAPPFDGHKGSPLTFREWDHQLRQPMYLVAPRKQAQGKARWDVLEAVGEVPLPEARGAAEPLDSLGATQEESNCKLEPLAP